MISTHGQMSVGLKWNLQTFNETLRSAIRESSRAAPDVVNGHALGVAIKAIELTEKANKDKIAHQLGQIANKITYIAARESRIIKGRKARASRPGRVIKRGKNKGKYIGPREAREATADRRTRATKARFKRGDAVLAQNSFAARIVNARRRDFAGVDYMLWGSTLEKAARKLIIARQKSVAFIKSGWLWALRDLMIAVGRAGFLTAKRRVASEERNVNTRVRKGGAVPARQGATPKASIYNTALVQSGGKFQSKGTHNPWPIAEKGLRAALRAEEGSMRQHLFNKMMAAMKRAKAV